MSEAEWLICADPAAMLGLLGSHVSVRKLRLFGAACCRRAESASQGEVAKRGIDLAYRLADELEIGRNLTRFRSDLLYEGFFNNIEFWQKRAGMACWHQALAVFNVLQDSDRFRAGERRPVFGVSLQGHHDDVLHFALSEARKETGPGGKPVFDRPDICRPDLTRVCVEAALAVAYHRRPDNRPEVAVVQMLTGSDARRRREDWETALEADFRFEAEQQTILARDIFANPFYPVMFDMGRVTDAAVSLADAIYREEAFERLPALADVLEASGCDDSRILAHCRNRGPHVRGCWVVDLLLGKELEALTE